MPTTAQKAYFAVRAFNVELASIKDGYHVRNTGLETHDGSILALQVRMQWWRDALAEIYGEERTSKDPAVQRLSVSCWHSPVVRALHEANDDHQFTRRFLERLIDAREADLDEQQYKTMNQVKEYAEATVSSLLYLSLESVGVRREGPGCD